MEISSKSTQHINIGIYFIKESIISEELNVKHLLHR